MKNLLSTLAAAALASSCGSTWYAHRFVPAPLEAQVGVDGDSSAQARTLVTIRGIRRASASAGRPAQVEVRLRLENLGSTPAVLDLSDLSLVTSDLESFGPAVVEPPTADPVAAGEYAIWDVSFPLPAGRSLGELDLQGVNLKWSVRFGDVRVTTGATFQRRWPGDGYGPYWLPYGYP